MPVINFEIKNRRLISALLVKSRIIQYMFNDKSINAVAFAQGWWQAQLAQQSEVRSTLEFPSMAIDLYKHFKRSYEFDTAKYELSEAGIFHRLRYPRSFPGTITPEVYEEFCMKPRLEEAYVFKRHQIVLSDDEQAMADKIARCLCKTYMELDSDDAVMLVGDGHEKNNREAIKTWVRKALFFYGLPFNSSSTEFLQKKLDEVWVTWENPLWSFENKEFPQ